MISPSPELQRQLRSARHLFYTELQYLKKTTALCCLTLSTGSEDDQYRWSVAMAGGKVWLDELLMCISDWFFRILAMFRWSGDSIVENDASMAATFEVASQLWDTLHINALEYHPHHRKILECAQIIDKFSAYRFSQTYHYRRVLDENRAIRIKTKSPDSAHPAFSEWLEDVVNSSVSISSLLSTHASRLNSLFEDALRNKLVDLWHENELERYKRRPTSRKPIETLRTEVIICDRISQQIALLTFKARPNGRETLEDATEKNANANGAEVFAGNDSRGVHLHQPLFFAKTGSYQTLVVNGAEYQLTPQQANIIKTLHDAGGALSSKDIKDQTKCGKISDSFRTADGRKVWKLLIEVAKGRKGFYRLKSSIPPRSGS